MTSLTCPLSEGSLKNAARQIHGCLPGGVVILGVGLGLIQVTTLKSQLNHYRSMLESIWRRTNDDTLSLLAYCSLETKKIRCMSVDVGYGRSHLIMPGTEVKVSANQRLIRINGIISFDVDDHVTCHVTSKTLSDHVMSSCLDALSKSTFTCHGTIPHHDQTISSISRETSLWIDVHWNNDEIIADAAPFLTQPGHYQLTINDGIHCRAYVHPSVTWSTAINMLKDDVANSVKMRLNMMMADITDGWEDDKMIKLILLRRVWFKDSINPFSICEYCYPDEGPNDVIDNIISIWGKSHSANLTCENEFNETVKVEQAKMINEEVNSLLPSHTSSGNVIIVNICSTIIPPSHSGPSMSWYYLIFISLIILLISIVGIYLFK
jgi:hypothetical protein